MITDDQFQMMNFGRVENEKRYGQRQPPVYNLQNVIFNYYYSSLNYYFYFIFYY